MVNQHDPLRFINRLFEIAVWPFQNAAKYSANSLPLHDQRLMVPLLMPAMLLFIPLCMLISVVAIAYVFLVLPLIYICRTAAKMLSR